MSAGYGPLIEAAADPLALFTQWLAEARHHEVNDPEAMCVSTVGADGMPSSRMVLLKSHDADGFTFYTNTLSRKGQQLAGNAQAALLFHWKSLRRQVRVEGAVVTVDPAVADSYFTTRPRDSQLAAWASHQSAPLQSRAQFEAALAAAAERFSGRPVPRPPHWSGYCVCPRYFEFWQEQPFRCHDRVAYTPLPEPAAGWTHVRLFP